MLEKEDYSFFESTKMVIDRESPDLSIVNFETAIVDDDNTKPIKKSGPSLCTSRNAVKALKYAGFNFATLANNHIMDYGVKGLNNTVAELIAANIQTVGIGDNAENASKPTRVQICNEKLSVINCCEHEFSVATKDEPGAFGLDPIEQYRIIVEEKKVSDYVIVIVHGGPEFYQIPTSRMVKTYRFFIDAGADIVINGHQHCYSGYEVYKGKMIFYGLGNFCFDWAGYRDSTWNEGYLVNLDLNREKIEYRIIPYQQCNHTANIEYLKENAYDVKLSEINTVIADDKLLDCKTEEYFNNSYKIFLHVFEPQLKIFPYLKRLGLCSFKLSEGKGLLFRDFIDCESHRDKILYYLRNTFK
jgi:poly-gamma-glutamate synthesis protein (capsule biosynthesis protein)